MEMNLAWNLTEKERLTLYYDSAEELGRLAGFDWFIFASSGGQSRIECVAFTLP